MTTIRQRQRSAAADAEEQASRTECQQQGRSTKGVRLEPLEAECQGQISPRATDMSCKVAEVATATPNITS